MHLDLLEGTLLRVAPFPQIVKDGSLIDGLVQRQSDTCRQCSDRRCTLEHESRDLIEPRFGTCYRGMGTAAVSFGTRNVVFNGLLLPEQFSRMSRKDKKKSMVHRVKPEDISAWIQRTRTMIASLDQTIQARISDSLGMLHDIETSVSAVLRAAEQYIQQQPGSTYDERFDALPPSAKSIVAAAQILNARLPLMPLLTNPDAAKYGQRHPTPVYRVIDRLVRTMRPLADKGRVDLVLHGNSFKQPLAYHSFESIPLILIDNAIKYSREDQRVDVDVNDRARGVEVTVRSFSPCIDEADRARIFERGFRGATATRLVARGSGLGLYLAQLVAQANGFAITHNSDPPSVSVGGIPYCLNAFAFNIPMS